MIDDKKLNELWTIPERHKEKKKMIAIWDLIVDFCKKYNLLDVPYFFYAEMVIDDYAIAKQCVQELEDDGVLMDEIKHKDRSKKKHPASVTYFKAINSMKRSLKALIKNAARNSDNAEDIAGDPLTKFFEKWSEK